MDEAYIFDRTSISRLKLYLIDLIHPRKWLLFLHTWGEVPLSWTHISSPELHVPLQRPDCIALGVGEWDVSRFFPLAGEYCLVVWLVSRSSRTRGRLVWSMAGESCESWMSSGLYAAVMWWGGGVHNCASPINQ